MNDAQLDDVFDQLLNARDTREMKTVVSALGDGDLNLAYDHFFDLYIEELAQLAEDDCAYVCQNCMKTTTDGASEFFQSAVSVLGGEIENRKRFVAASKLPN
ncbi:MAG TPA: hypothetical protein VG675_19475 [Bryobacteraceae bacterium]|nr:hypothetical protein [Bryobacteraceae bacterium]